MKKALLVLAVVMVAFPMLASAQRVQVAGAYDRALVGDTKDSFVKVRFNGPDDGEPAESGGGSWGGFGGVMLQYLWLDFSAFDALTEDRGIDNFSQQVFLIGGMGGLIYQDFRLGGFGFGNSWETVDKVAGKRRTADLTIGGGGVFIEWNHATSPMSGISLGTLLGVASINLKATGKDLDVVAGTDDSWSADQSCFMVNPYVGFWFAPTKWMWAELSGGYLFFNFDGDLDRYEHFNGVSDIEMVDGDITGGWQIALKINFGLNPNL